MPVHCSTSCGFEQSKVSARHPACAEASLSVAGSGAQAALWLDTFAARKTHLATARSLYKKSVYLSPALSKLAVHAERQKHRYLSRRRLGVPSDRHAGEVLEPSRAVVSDDCGYMHIKTKSNYNFAMHHSP